MGDSLCDMDGCRGRPAFNPVVLVPVEKQEEPAGLLLKLNVCADCKERVGLDDLITEEGRGEILAAVLHQCGIPATWDSVTLSWQPLGGDGADEGGFVDRYLNPEEAGEVLQEASDAIKAFMLRGRAQVSFDEGATRLTALVVAGMLDGYQRYRVARSDAGQQFLSAVLQTLSSHIKGRTGDSVAVRVVVTQDPDAV